jgi:NADH:ubiquinone oxidoreductase subunit E
MEGESGHGKRSIKFRFLLAHGEKSLMFSGTVFKMKLTARQQEVLDYLQSEHRRSGIMPSTREIQEHFGFASQTAAVMPASAPENPSSTPSAVATPLPSMMRAGMCGFGQVSGRAMIACGLKGGQGTACPARAIRTKLVHNFGPAAVSGHLFKTLRYAWGTHASR